MSKTWDEIDKWLQKNAPDIYKDLLPGASPKQIKEAEAKMGIEFPDDVRESYSVHDGQAGHTELFAGWQLYSLKYMVKQWQVLKKLYDKGTFAQAPGEPVGPIKPDWWNPRWIPLTDNGAGDMHCLDLDPPTKGKSGQIISFWHMDAKREKIAPSFESYLVTFAADLKRNRYKVVDGRLKAGE